MNKELISALDLLEKTKNISKEEMIEAIENSLLSACKSRYGTSDNISVNIDRVKGDISLIQKKIVVDSINDGISDENKSMYISLDSAREIDPKYEIGDVVTTEIDSKGFGRIAAGVAKNIIMQKVIEAQRKSVYEQFVEKERDIVTGVVQRYIGKNVGIDLGDTEAILSEGEMVEGENLQPRQRIKLYVLEVKESNKGAKVVVSRTHPDLVKRLLENEVTEIRDGIVEIKSIAREAGSRTKIAVLSNDPDVDPIGACVGINQSRISVVVDELFGEKIDVIKWDDNPALLIENALSPSKVICVLADEDDKEAIVIVPDNQLSLAIGKEGQNARLAAKLTGFKIDIKSESQARDSGLLDELGIEYTQSEDENENNEVSELDD